MNSAVNNSTLKNLLVFDSHGVGTEKSCFRYPQFSFIKSLILLALKKRFTEGFSVSLGTEIRKTTYGGSEQLRCYYPL